MQRSLPPAADRAGLGLVIAGFVFAALSGVPNQWQPTLAIGERFLTTDLGSPGRGDIIVFNPPAGADDGTCGTRPREGSVRPQGTADRSESKFVKRVVAVGGDRVAIRDGRVVLNGPVQDRRGP